jgi:hypothetical protein
VNDQSQPFGADELRDLFDGKGWNDQLTVDRLRATIETQERALGYERNAGRNLMLALDEANARAEKWCHQAWERDAAVSALNVRANALRDRCDELEHALAQVRKACKRRSRGMYGADSKVIEIGRIVDRARKEVP